MVKDFYTKGSDKMKKLLLVLLITYIPYKGFTKESKKDVYTYTQIALKMQKHCMKAEYDNFVLSKVKISMFFGVKPDAVNKEIIEAYKYIMFNLCKVEQERLLIEEHF